MRATRRQGIFTLDVEFAGDDAPITALFGRSGAGKSTVIEIVAGLRRPDRGRISVGEVVLFDSERRIDLAPRRRRVGLVSQDGRLFPHYSVRGNLLYGYRRAPAGERRLEPGAVAELLGISPLLDRRPGGLSGGERQRVAIGRALLASPRLLLLDEPLAALDGARKAELMPFIGRLAREFRVPVLYVTHSADEVLHLADRLVMIEAGRVIAAGAVEEVMNRPEFVAVAAGGRGELAARAEPMTVIGAIVAGHEGEGTVLAFPGGRLSVPRLDQVPGSRVRLTVAAGEVILALTRPQGLSVRNVLPARVTGIAEAEAGLVDVQLDIGVPLKARVTAAARRELALAPGLDLFALVKSAAIQPGDIAARGPG